MKKQVDKSHYRFSRYLHKRRWASIWHQVDEVLQFEPARVLEIGPGAGIFKAVCRPLGVNVETVDVDPELEPDHVCSVLDLPFADASFDVSCAFQMLEHIPFEDSLKAIAELARVASKGVVVSLPDADPAWPQMLTVPGVGKRAFLLRRPFFKPRDHRFNGEHYWEINKRGYGLEHVTSRLVAAAGLDLARTYRVEEFPYHRFFVFARDPSSAWSSQSAGTATEA
ncbi:class I SAM-dependent methyltransferase [Pseudoxanthomonas suwonensis]|uniref:class I SAM-dependent methyltransferase n=1 Tax=Pseudoxanthomonas suwonensis TaxID=314722 RepID=UPI0004649DE7|nr:class I SAM-dependent methyltransferase [Pseudoxanthomonas suwonensis]